MFLLFYIYIYYLIEGNLLITEVANEPDILTDQKELVPKDFTSIVEKFGPSFGTFPTIATGGSNTSTAPPQQGVGVRHHGCHCEDRQG